MCKLRAKVELWCIGGDRHLPTEMLLTPRPRRITRCPRLSGFSFEETLWHHR